MDVYACLVGRARHDTPGVMPTGSRNAETLRLALAVAKQTYYPHIPRLRSPPSCALVPGPTNRLFPPPRGFNPGEQHPKSHLPPNASASSIAAAFDRSKGQAENQQPFTQRNLTVRAFSKRTFSSSSLFEDIGSGIL